jgi:hypothetical protein
MRPSVGRLLRTRVRDCAAVGVPLALGVLQLIHPTWTGGSWIPLHALLLVGYIALALTLWPKNFLTRVLLAAFVVCNTAFLLVDGIVVGSVAPSTPSAADSVWNSPIAIGLGDLTGALWCAALLAVGVTRVSGQQLRHAPPRWLIVLAFLIWAGFVASLVTPAAIVVGSLALVFAVYRIYTRRGAHAGVIFGLLALAALSRQHVGLEAALGMLWIALAALVDALRGRPDHGRAATGRPGPGASSLPESG